MIDADRRGFRYTGTSDRGVFQLDRADPFAAGLDDVLRPVGDLHCTVGMDDGNIAGIEPIVVADAFAIIILEILVEHPGTAHEKLAGAFPISRQVVAVVINNLDLDAERRAALFGNNIDLFLEAEIIPIMRGACQWCRSGRFRSSPRHGGHTRHSS